MVDPASDPTAPAVILVHGQGGCKNSIDMLVPAGMLWRNGFNVLLIDLRDVGDSTFEDGRSTIGNAEHRDVLGAWDWLVKAKGFDPKRIGLFANSMGGANANYAFSEEPRVAALFLQSTFGNLQQVIATELARNGYPTFLAPAALAMGSVVTGENLFARSPVETIQKAAGRPVYIVHTRADTRIDIGQSEQLAAAAQAAGAKVTDLVPGERRARADAGSLSAGVRAAAGGVLQGGVGRAELTRDANGGQSDRRNLGGLNS